MRRRSRASARTLVSRSGLVTRFNSLWMCRPMCRDVMTTMTFKDYVGLASEVQKGLTIVVALASAIAPAFLGTQPSLRWFAVVGGVVGTVAGALVGLTARQRSNT